ncbi:hypothetical protein DESA109040_19040 [Deinococcus saxicola]|uniref:hypothetical protein n=1 Tax=Deinococcus saxicola TaxID=249406 RepID=UPI0039EFF619
MASKAMSSSLQKRASRLTAASGRQRLIESITGSLHVAGYAVKRSAVAQALSQRRKPFDSDSTTPPHN